MLLSSVVFPLLSGEADDAEEAACLSSSLFLRAAALSTGSVQVSYISTHFVRHAILHSGTNRTYSACPARPRAFSFCSTTYW